MTQLTINIENKDMLPILKKLLGELNGVSIDKIVRKKKSGLELAMEDVKAGRVSEVFNDVDQLMAHLNNV